MEDGQDRLEWHELRPGEWHLQVNRVPKSAFVVKDGTVQSGVFSGIASQAGPFGDDAAAMKWCEEWLWRWCLALVGTLHHRSETQRFIVGIDSADGYDDEVLAEIAEEGGRFEPPEKPAKKQVKGWWRKKK